jgi:DNA end-binding protein Ku
MAGRTRVALLLGAALAALIVVLLRRGGAPVEAPPVPQPVPAEPEPEPEPGPALDGLTRAELYERAQAIDLPGRSKMTKAELRQALGGL